MEDKKTLTDERIALARDFLSGYRVCEALLGVRRYERKRARKIDLEETDCEALLLGDEATWRMRMYEVEHLIASLSNSKEKIILYYRYIKGESVEHVSDLLGFSRRTGYRLLNRGLLAVGSRLKRMNAEDFTSKKSE